MRSALGARVRSLLGARRGCECYYSVTMCVDEDVVVWTTSDLSALEDQVVLWLGFCWTVERGTPPDLEPLPDIPVADLVAVDDCEDADCPDTPSSPPDSDCTTVCTDSCLNLATTVSFASVVVDFEFAGDCCRGAVERSLWSAGLSGSWTLDERLGAPPCTGVRRHFNYTIFAGGSCNGSLEYQEDEDREATPGVCGSARGCYFAAPGSGGDPITLVQTGCNFAFDGDADVTNDPIGRTFNTIDDPAGGDCGVGGDVVTGQVVFLVYGGKGCCWDGGDCVEDGASTDCEACP